MTAAITHADVQAELPSVEIDDESLPNRAQVDQYIADTEGEVMAIWESCGGVWPPDASTSAWAFIRRTELEGVRWLVLRAKFAMVPSVAASPDIQLAQAAYQSRLDRLCNLARQGVPATTGAGASAGSAGTGPLLALAPGAPRLWPSFGEWTEAQVWADAGSVRRGGQPYPL